MLASKNMHVQMNEFSEGHLYVTLRHDFMPSHFVHGELDVQTIGHALMSSGKYGYVLPFEVISILLLACIVGGILIARKR